MKNANEQLLTEQRRRILDAARSVYTQALRPDGYIAARGNADQLPEILRAASIYS